LDFAQIGGAGQIDEQHSYQPLASLQPAAHRALGSAGICGRSGMTEISAVGRI
jgi:hypothetical protein